MKSKLYEEEILELAKQEAKAEEEDPSKKKKRVKLMYESRLRTFTHERESEEGQQKKKRTAHKQQFSEEEMKRRKQTVRMKKIKRNTRFELQLILLSQNVWHLKMKI